MEGVGRWQQAVRRWAWGQADGQPWRRPEQVEGSRNLESGWMGSTEAGRRWSTVGRSEVTGSDEIGHRDGPAAVVEVSGRGEGRRWFRMGRRREPRGFRVWAWGSLEHRMKVGWISVYRKGGWGFAESVVERSVGERGGSKGGGGSRWWRSGGWWGMGSADDGVKTEVGSGFGWV